MKKILFFLIIILTLPSIADAQRWKQYRRQIIGGAGVTNFLGDMGGGNDIGRDFIWDLDFAATRPSLLIGYRYQLNTYMFLRANLNWGILKADDQLTKQTQRRHRNLNFRTGFLELDALAEFYVIQNSRGNLYRLRGVRGRRGLAMDLYVFGGLGLMYFNPKAQYQGTWTALQPLGTEGQGQAGQDDKYSRLTFTIPYGIGVGKSIDRYWGINVEFTMRATFTDYIDDVSGNYYGRQNIYDAKIAEGLSVAEATQAAYLSDPNLTYLSEPNASFSFHDLGSDNARNEAIGNDIAVNQRGDASDKDAFMTGMVTISRKIVKRRRSRPKF
jgi:hypothetical protein